VPPQGGSFSIPKELNLLSSGFGTVSPRLASFLFYMSLPSDFHRHKSFIEYRAPIPLYVAPQNEAYKALERTELELMWRSVQEAYDILGLERIPPFPREPFSTDKLVAWLNTN
jgi:hypothetical protein